MEPTNEATKPLSSFEKKLNDWVSIHLSRVPFIEKIFFIDHLKTMLHAGLSLVEALGVLERETTNKKFGIILQTIRAEVEKGRQLSDVLAEHEKIFPSMYVKMIRAGEVAGQLEGSLFQVAEQMKRARELSSSIRGAMIYPAVIITAMGGIGIMMATVVLPKLVQIFSEFDADLPLATRILIKTTDLLSNPLFLSLSILLVVGCIAGFVSLLKHSLGFKRTIHRINLHLPIAGKIIKKINLAKFSLTLSSLLDSTVPIIEAVGITADTCSNVLYKETLTNATEVIATGMPLSSILAEHPTLYPPMVTEMVMVGERSGEINTLLKELAGFYASEVQKTMENFTKIIEPIIIIVIGIAVAGLAIAVIMPMYNLVQNF